MGRIEFGYGLYILLANWKCQHSSFKVKNKLDF